MGNINALHFYPFIFYHISRDSLIDSLKKIVIIGVAADWTPKDAGGV